MLGKQKNYQLSKGLIIENVTLRAYAQMHKLSYFKVMKMVRNQEIKSILIEENGKEVEYVDMEEEKKRVIEDPVKKMTLKDENAALKKEVLRLKVELERCNKRTILA
ncbi:MAG: Unknown protein [uncultured Sulfurovum sp.]|uniref:Uncharacterized protein n=1 Tax=uncultured Sulfurovum sp. TaxID=269237 RepID=A0A6S6SK02_9BACT|nr:MAG: Unknown protein [uncultured Sulfurovum sp.]